MLKNWTKICVAALLALADFLLGVFATNTVVDIRLFLEYWFLVTALSFAGLGVSAWIYDLLQNQWSSWNDFYVGTSVFAIVWMIVFSLAPVFGQSTIPLDYSLHNLLFPIGQLIFAGMFAGVTLLASRRLGRHPRMFAVSLLWCLIVFFVLFPSALIAPSRYLHLVSVVALFLGLGATQVRPRPARTLVVAGISVCVLMFAPNDLRYLVGERSRVWFHLQNATAIESFETKYLDCPIKLANTDPPDYPKIDSLVVIMLDTFRTDRLFHERVGAEITPNLNAFASQSWMFSSAYTVFPATSGAVKSIGSGRYESKSGFALGERLSRAGVTLEAVAVHPNAISPLGELFTKFPLDLEDFDHRFDITSHQVTNQGIARFNELNRQQSQFLLWLHYYDPHAYYVPNDKFSYGSQPMSLYDAEVSLMDMEIGRLLAHVGENVAVLIISDHGEEFGDHGSFRHGNRIYDESSRIVTLLRLPGMGPKVFSAPVSTVDIAPTVLALFGLDNIPSDGLKLGAAGASRTVRVDGLQRRGVVSTDRKFIWNQGSQTIEVYDRIGDPLESKNLYDSSQDCAASLLVRD